MNDEKRIFCENNLVVATKFYFRLTTGKNTDVAVRIRDLEVRNCKGLEICKIYTIKLFAGVLHRKLQIYKVTMDHSVTPCELVDRLYVALA